ncbi:hypothetical protein Patl1_16657 [Pistacia atlantica]|uniref:Uncharacterized protein n=1 Tax=Pistacia atlantica TaxID=434234 RepID=A0ACC1B5D2_9ROSI|nr:hypothetical protein Patl1_16657 [Pistacia atlantica]
MEVLCLFLLLKKGMNFHKNQGALAASEKLIFKTAEGEDGYFSAKDSFPSVSVDFSANLSEGTVPAQKMNKVLDRSNNFSFLVAAEDKAGDAPIPNDSLGVETINLCAPDPLDFVQDNSAHSPPATQDKKMDTFNSTANSGKSDSDSIGQEIATAMMTVLLPQAIPLLNKVSRKKKATLKASESLSCRVNPKKNDETSCFVDASFPESDVCVNFDQNSAGIGIHLVEKDIKIESDCIEDANDAHQRGMINSVQLSGKDISTKIAASETVSVAEAPKKVYSRKKETLAVSVISEMKSSDDKQHEEDFGAKTRLEEQSHVSSVISQNAAVLGDSKGEELCNSSDPYAIHMKSEGHSDEELFGQMKPFKVSSDTKLQKNVELNNELEGIVDFAGCYFHPMPISSVLLTTKGNEIYICVSCGLLNEKNRTLFIYKVAIQEQSVGCPSFIGHTSVILPFLKDIFGRDIALETSCWLFTPDGQCLVLLGRIETPYCREGRIDCLCSTCTLECSEKNAVKIVQAKSGYVSVVANLKTDDSVQCILVCEPYYVIAVGESGRMHVWEMDSTWSAQIEEFVISVDDYIYPCIVELKKIPNSASLVVGHNGFGEFGLWYVASEFLSSLGYFETSLSVKVLCSKHFNLSILSNKFLLLAKRYLCFHQELVWRRTSKELWMQQICGSQNTMRTILFFSRRGKILPFGFLSQLPLFLKLNMNHISSDCQTNPVRFWRLALLVKNMVILGSTLDPRAAAIGAFSGHGIIGTDDGLVYAWELSSGTKLGTLHHFKGSTVSCIATDDSNSQVLAVAGDGGQLLLYMHSGKNNANQ